MPPFRFPGPICQTKDWYDGVVEGALPRIMSPKPSVIGSSASLVPEKPSAKVIASGECTFLIPPKGYTVKAPKAAFDRLRAASSAAKISEPQSKASYTWPNGSSSSAIEQEIEIDGQKIEVIRPSDNEARGKNLPTTKQIAEGLRAVPKNQRAYSHMVIVSPRASPESTPTETIAGEGGSGNIWLYPVTDQQSQEDFDNRITHESGHNYQNQFWDSPGAVSDWQRFADADDWYPSRYGLTKTMEDFSEFLILYNTSKGTRCEDTARKMYPNRWKKLEEYQSR